MTSPATLDRWIDGIRHRSEEAFRAVYELLANDLASFANGMLRDGRAAEDVIQQAFLELVKAAPSLRGDGRALMAWLYRSVRYGCLDELRRRRRRPETPTARLPEPRRESTPEVMGELDPALEAALGGLTRRQRTMLVLRHVVGMSGEDIAAVMRISRPAVYAALARAERRLRAQLDTSTLATEGGR